MKKLLFLFLTVFCLMSCEKIDLSAQEETPSSGAQIANAKNVQFIMKGLSVEYSTRATLQSEGMTDLWLFEGGELLKHQTSTDPDFGNPTVSLKIGTHDLTFIASKSEGQTFNNGLWTCTKVNDTFGTVLNYTVSKSSSSKQVELKRITGKVQWTIEDAIPQGTTTTELIIPQCFALDASLNGKEQSNFNPSFNISGYVNTIGLTLSATTLPQDPLKGSTISPTIKISSNVGLLCEYTTECTVKANVVTNIHGTFFSGGSTQMVSLTSTWDGQTDVNLY